MDSLPAVGTSLPMRQSGVAATRDATAGSFAPILAAEQNPPAALSGHGGDPAADQQRMLHFISHVNAECFISLLKIMDPKPDDYRARAEYKRYYNQLRETLEVPLPPQLPPSAHLPTE